MATISVVLLHVAGNVVTQGPLNTSAWWAGNVDDSLSHWFDPTFVMLSGAILLNPSPNEDFSSFFRRRASRIILPLLAWTIVIFDCA